MRFSTLIITGLILIFFFACNDDTEPTPDSIVINIYENCCGVPPVEMDFNPGKVYLPNIFTPKNLDGINDVFFVLTDSEIITVEEFRIMDATGVVVYEFLDFVPNDQVYGWFPDETVENGYYEYFVKVKNINGDEFDITGGVCVFECDEENPFDYTGDCGSPAQHSGQGTFDGTLPDNESDCL